MHELEPFYNWQHLYLASEDEESPFYGVEYSEFEFSNTVYNFYIHPQWDNMGSETLYLKILFVSILKNANSSYLHILRTQHNFLVSLSVNSLLGAILILPFLPEFLEFW